MVYPLTLYSPFIGFYFFNGLMCVLQVLHIFWAGLILRMVIKFLPGNVRTTTLSFPYHAVHRQPEPMNVLCFFLQDIVEDERSDKEETESDEDEDVDHELRKKRANGHMRNGHTPLNNNHSKRD